VPAIPTWDLRARPHRGPVPSPAHDGHLGQRPVQRTIHGELDFDLAKPLDATFRGEIDAAGLWTGEKDRDEHLGSADFFGVESHPKIAFEGRFVDRTGDTSFKATADLTIRANTRHVEAMLLDDLEATGAVSYYR
jgi:hypothetical protein